MGQGCSCFVGTAVKIDSVSMDTSQSATPTKKNGVNGVLVSSLDAEKSLIEAMNLSGGFTKQGSIPLVRFTVKDLSKATKTFREDLVLGEGAFGKVFKGTVSVPHLGGHLACAIKKLNPDSLQGQEEWMAEILILGSVKHPNLIRLFGYCTDKKVGYLVYELAPMGSLDKLLYREKKSSTMFLTWRNRVKIAYQIAQALNHLHQKKIIHRDLKPSNVLLDENMNVKLTDFGLAKVASSSQTNLTTRVLGTMGYLDPHYVETGQVSRLSDVYAYGVMLLEILTGRKSIMSGVSDSKPLPSFAQEFFSQRRPNVLAFLDPEMVEEVCLMGDIKVATYLGITAKHCTSWNVSQRPTMMEVVDVFNNLMKDHEANCANLN